MVQEGGTSAAEKRSTDGFSIASLICGILGVSILGLIFGFVGLSRTKAGKAPGRGLAIAGVALSAVWLVVGVGLVSWIFLTSDAETSAPTAAAAVTYEAGDCLGEQIGPRPAPVVSCDTPHDIELIAEQETESLDDCRAAVSSLPDSEDTGNNEMVTVINQMPVTEDGDFVVGGTSTRWCVIQDLVGSVNGGTFVGSFADGTARLASSQ